MVGVPAAVLGAIAAESLLALLRPGETRAVPVAVLAASVALAGSVLLVAGRAWHAATRPVVRGAGDEVGRMPRAAVAGGVVLVAVAAGAQRGNLVVERVPRAGEHGGKRESGDPQHGHERRRRVEAGTSRQLAHLSLIHI